MMTNNVRTWDEIIEWVESHDTRIIQAGQFPAQVLLCDPDEHLPLLSDFLDLGDEGTGDWFGGRTYEYCGHDYMLVIIAIRPGNQAIGTIAHECYHAVNFIYKRYGAKHSLVNDEPTAYLISHIAYYVSKYLEERGYGFTRLGQQAGDSATDESDSLHIRGGISGTGQAGESVGTGPEPSAGSTILCEHIDPALSAK